MNREKFEEAVLAFIQVLPIVMTIVSAIILRALNSSKLDTDNRKLIGSEKLYAWATFMVEVAEELDKEIQAAKKAK